MTVHDIIRIAFANEYESFENDTEAAESSIDILNLLLADCYEAEQYSREIKGDTLLTAIPVVSEMDDVVPYNDILTRTALPYGIEWKFCEQNLDARAEQYRARYLQAKQSAGGKYYAAREKRRMNDSV